MKKIIFGLLLSIVALADDGTGLKISGNADIVGQTVFGDPNDTLPPFLVREAEVMLYAPTDYLFDGVVSLAAHEEDGEWLFELHEAYLGSTKLIPRSRIRLGQFFLGVGRLNQFHRHDWPFITAPKVHQEFFGEEAWRDTGLEYSWLTPLPFYLDFTVGLTNGWVRGHVHGLGAKPRVPTHYFRLATYGDVSDGAGLQVGFNYVGRTDTNALTMNLVGADLTAKVKSEGRLIWLIQGELWYRFLEQSSGGPEKALGFYIFPNYSFAPRWSVGLRLDGYTVVNKADTFGSPVSNFDLALMPQISFDASEFTKLKLALTYKHETEENTPTFNELRAELQAVFMLGAHPSHDF